MIAKIMYGIYRTLTPERVKNSLRMNLVLQRSDEAKEIRDFNSRRIVVLAPHMDDEVAGCGGILHMHAAAGADLTTVYLTDGSRGDPDLYGKRLTAKELKDAETSLVSRRKSEAAAAAEILGINELVFLDNQDGTLAPDLKIIKEVREILFDKRPDIIYLPSLMDSHCDHWATNLILYGAMKDRDHLNVWSPVYRGYEVWMPLPVNRIANINNSIGIKRRALETFRSQISHIDYVRAITSLNAYRSIYFQRGKGYAEAFLETSPKEYETVLRAYKERR